MNTLTCYRCLTPQYKDELREGNKVKSLSYSSSKIIRMCKNCKCKVFIQMELIDDT